MLKAQIATRLFLCLLLGLALLAERCVAAAKTRFDIVGVPAGFAMYGVEVQQGAETLRYYLSAASPEADALVVLVPGSGCDGAFRKTSNQPAQVGLEIFVLPHRRQAQLLLLEPPGIPRQHASPEPGVAEYCPRTYLAQSRFSAILASYQRAIAEVLQTSQQIRKIHFIASSDGVPYASVLASTLPQTRMLTLISGFGIGHLHPVLHDALAAALSDPSSSTKALKATIAGWEDILRNPTSSQRFVGGQPYTRWASTALVSSAAWVAKLPENVTVLLVQGGQDHPALIDFSAGIATLMAQRKAFAFKIIPCANHQIVCPQEPDPTAQLALTLSVAMEWFFTGQSDRDEQIVHFAPPPSFPNARLTR